MYCTVKCKCKECKNLEGNDERERIVEPPRERPTADDGDGDGKGGGGGCWGDELDVRGGRAVDRVTAAPMAPRHHAHEAFPPRGGGIGGPSPHPPAGAGPAPAGLLAQVRAQVLPAVHSRANRQRAQTLLITLAVQRC